MKSKTKGRATTKNEKVVLYVLGILSIFALCYLFIISPGEEKTKNLKQEIKNLESQLVSVQSIDYDIEQRKKTLDELMVKYKEATVTLPKTDRYPEVFRDIEKMVTESGLSASNGSFGKASVITIGAEEGQDTSNLKGMRKVQITYSIKGDINKVLSFIDKLENYDRIAELNSFNHSAENCSIVFSFYDSGEGGVEEYDFN
ncbi:type 4a pilus biogenesis protein PilO [Clostridium paraputrificum]|uniref:Pilus assembly protein, PilO n=1 Tax=Clostridium paraputrificum TaxID=29363 RepID=A0A6N3CWV8_9CLOT